MKINNLLENITPTSNPDQGQGGQAPKFDRSDKVLEDDTIEETTAGSVASVATPMGGTQSRAKGSMLQGIKTSDKYPNSKAVKEGLPKQPKDEFKRQALLVKDRKTGKLYDPEKEFDKTMNSPEFKSQMKRMATKESQINEVDPRNFDSDEDYYAARNAPAKARSQARQSPGVNQDDEAYFREIFRKKRLAAQQQERDADHDRLATGTNEGEEMGTFAALKDWRVWDVRVFNNYYRGKYADYGPRLYSVVASSPEEARQVVISNPDYVLQDLLSRKLQNGKKVLPRGSALPIEEKRVGQADPGSITTMGLKKMLTPDGVQSFKFTNGKIVDGSHVKGGEEQGVAEMDGDNAGRSGREFGKEHTSKVMKAKDAVKHAAKWLTEPQGPQQELVRNRAKNIADIRKNKGVAEETNAPIKYRATVEYGPTAADAHFVTVTANSTEEAEAKVQKWCEKKGVQNPMITINGADKPIAEKSKSQAQFRTMAAVAHNPKFAKKVGISQKVGKEFHSADRKQDYKDLPNKTEGQEFDESLEKDFQKVDYRKFSTPTLMNALKTLAKSKTPNVDLQKGISRELLNRVKNKEGVAEEKQRLDPKCWSGYKKQGTKMKGDTRVNNCVKVDEAEFTEDKLAQELYKDLQMFKKGIDKDIGAKAKDKDIIAKEESKGLWANIHAKQNRIKNGSGEKMRKPGSKGAPTSQNFKDASAKNESTGEYDDEAGSAESNLLTMARAVKGLLDTIEDKDNLPEWVQEKIAKAEQMLVTSWDYLLSQKEQGHDPQVDEDWQKANKSDKTDGMSSKAVKAYRRENPGSKLKTAVTTKPSKLKPGSKAAKRRKSFCARMSGNKGPMKDEKGRPTPKAKALSRWNC